MHGGGHGTIGGDCEIGVQQIGAFDEQQVMTIQAVVLAYGFNCDIFQQHTYNLFAIHIHYHATLESNESIQRGEAADITIVGRIETGRGQKDAIGAESHAETRSRYNMDDVDDDGVREIYADGVRDGNATFLLFMGDQLEKQTDVVLIPLQHFLGLGPGTVGREAHDTGFDRQILAIVLGVVGNDHGHGAQPFAGLRTQSPQKRNIAS